MNKFCLGEIVEEWRTRMLRNILFMVVEFENVHSKENKRLIILCTYMEYLCIKIKTKCFIFFLFYEWREWTDRIILAWHELVAFLSLSSIFSCLFLFFHKIQIWISLTLFFSESLPLNREHDLHVQLYQ